MVLLEKEENIKEKHVWKLTEKKPKIKSAYYAFIYYLKASCSILGHCLAYLSKGQSRSLGINLRAF